MDTSTVGLLGGGGLTLRSERPVVVFAQGGQREVADNAAELGHNAAGALHVGLDRVRPACRHLLVVVVARPNSDKNARYLNTALIISMLV